MSEDRFHVGLVHNPLDVALGVRFLQDERSGGHVLFLGTTRRWTDDRETLQLSYECYERMALREMEGLAGEAIERWPITRALIVHRLGEVPAGEASILVGACAPHRGEAFEAARFLIDTVKRRVPIWKKELYADGTTEWVQGTLPDADAEG